MSVTSPQPVAGILASAVRVLRVREAGHFLPTLHGRARVELLQPFPAFGVFVHRGFRLGFWIIWVRWLGPRRRNVMSQLKLLSSAHVIVSLVCSAMRASKVASGNVSG
jgi:hypothetical protein